MTFETRSLKVIGSGTIRSLGMVSYSTSIATMAISRNVSETHRLIRQKWPNFLSPLVFDTPVRGEGVGVKQWPLV